MLSISCRTNPTKFLLLILISLALFLAAEAKGEAPPRFYWKTLTGTNVVPVIGMSVSGNVNPLDPTQHVFADSKISGEVALVGFAKTFELANRAATAAVLLPVGRLSSDLTIAGLTTRESTSGFGDPMVELGINVIGAPPIRNLPDLIRYEPKFSMDLIVDVVAPAGEYDSNQTLNLGLNRWYGRVGAPIVWQLGAWVPGRRTTLELLPAVWLFGDNDDFQGRSLETDPTFELDAHLTRDFTPNLWGSLDAIYTKSGDSKIDGVFASGGSDKLLAGFTLGYHINDNVQVMFGYRSTLNDGGANDINLDTFMFTIVAGWHPLLEGVRRLTGEQ